VEPVVLEVIDLDAYEKPFCRCVNTDAPVHSCIVIVLPTVDQGLRVISPYVDSPVFANVDLAVQREAWRT